MRGKRYLGLLVLLPWAFFRGMPLTFSGYGFDEQWFLWEGWSVRRGLTPYVDFFDFKPPVLFLTEAAALSLGLRGQCFRLFFLGLVLVAVASLVAALLRKGSVVPAYAVGFAVASLVLLPSVHDTSLNDVETIAVSYYLLGLAGLLAGYPVAGAALLVLSVLTRESFLFLALPTWASFLASSEDRRRFLGRSAAGGAVPTAIVCAYLAAVGGLVPWLESYRRSLSFAASYADRIGRWDPSGSWLKQAWWYFEDGPISLSDLAAIALFLFLGSTRSKLWGMLGLAGAAYAVTVGHCFWCHYFVVLIGGLAFWAALAARDLSNVGGAILGSCSLLAFALLTKLPSARVPDPAPAPVSAEVLSLVGSTGPADYVLSTSPSVYVWGDCRASLAQTAFLDELVDTYPGTADEDRFARLRAELASKPPSVIVLDELSVRRGQRHLRELLLPFMGNRYKQVGHYAFVVSVPHAL